MKSNISKRDWETISAYLDGQLSSRMQARFEARLSGDPELQDASEQIRRTRQILQNAPRVRAPRDFTLTPEMAGQPMRLPRLAPVFGWASALASFLLILVLVGDIFTPGGFTETAYNFSQQDGFVALKAQVVEDADTPPPSEDLFAADVVDKPANERLEVAGQSESPADEAAVEAAAAPVMESAPEEPVSDSQDEEIVVPGEQVTPEKPEMRALAAPEGEAGFDAQVGGVEESTGEQSASSEGVEQVGNLSESEAFSETVETETKEISPTDAPLIADELPLAEGEQSEQLTIDAETMPAAESPNDVPGPVDDQMPSVQEPAAEQVEPLIKVAPDTQLMAEPTPTSSWIVGEIPIKEAPVPDKGRDFVIGAEMILLLSAVGTGLAWIFLRRRGG